MTEPFMIESTETRCWYGLQVTLESRRYQDKPDTLIWRATISDRSGVVAAIIECQNKERAIRFGREHSESLSQTEDDHD